MLQYINMSTRNYSFYQKKKKKEEEEAATLNSQLPLGRFSLPLCYLLAVISPLQVPGDWTV